MSEIYTVSSPSKFLENPVSTKKERKICYLSLLLYNQVMVPLLLFLIFLYKIISAGLSQFVPFVLDNLKTK